MVFPGADGVTSVPESHLPAGFLGGRRDGVKLLVVDRKGGAISSDIFMNLSEYINEGDLLVVNNSRIIKASLSAYFPRLGKYGDFNFGTSRTGGMVLAEPRPKELNRDLRANDEVQLIGPDVSAKLIRKHEEFERFWWIDPGVDGNNLMTVMKSYGKPITYSHVAFPVSEDEYLTEFSRVPGSVEPPSAGIPFTEEVLDDVEGAGAEIAELTLHCNLGSLEFFEFSKKERLLNEEYSIPGRTLRKMVETRSNGGRVIAVGTTVVRALESYALENSIDYREEGSYEGSTDIFIKRGFNFRAVDGLITGMHDGGSSHIDMISALVGPEMLQTAYGLAVQWGYLWHEFGDMTMIL